MMENVEAESDAVFKALADPTRRLLLDRLRESDGQTLGQLSDQLDMKRQSATQHLDILVEANLVTIVRRGRERLHYLNPTPIHDIDIRWISAFDKPRLRALTAIKNQAEEETMLNQETTDQQKTEQQTSIPTYVYVTYIHATAERVWEALTDADLTPSYWGHTNVSDWQPGSKWEHRRSDGSGIADLVGEVIETDPPTRLVITFGAAEVPVAEQSIVTFVIEPHEDIVRLTVTHENLADETALVEISRGWPAVLANLKSFLETGAALPQKPWEVPTA